MRQGARTIPGVLYILRPGTLQYREAETEAAAGRAMQRERDGQWDACYLLTDNCKVYNEERHLSRRLN